MHTTVTQTISGPSGPSIKELPLRRRTDDARNFCPKQKPKNHQRNMFEKRGFLFKKISFDKNVLIICF